MMISSGTCLKQNGSVETLKLESFVSGGGDLKPADLVPKLAPKSSGEATWLLRRQELPLGEDVDSEG